LRAAVRAKRVLQACARAFNARPKRGIEALRATALLGAGAGGAAAFHAAVAELLLAHGASAGFDPVAIGEYLGSGEGADDDAKRRAHVHAFMDGAAARGASLIGALRAYLRSFRLPGEAQQIDRILQAFAAAAHTACAESALLASIDATYLLSFSIIMLNTDLHNPNIRADRRMTEAAFVRNNEFYSEEISHGRRIPAETLRAIYREIREHPIAPPPAAFAAIPLLAPSLDAAAAGAPANAAAAAAFAGAGMDAGQLVRHAQPRPGVPRFTLRVQYLRQPLSQWDSPAEHDARAAAEPGVRKGARMVEAELRHFALTGNFPSSARLPTLQASEHVFALAFPKVRQQLAGAVAPWVEPAWAYAMHLEDLRKAACNPFVEELEEEAADKVQKQRNREAAARATAAGGGAAAARSPKAAPANPARSPLVAGRPLRALGDAPQ